MCVIIFKAYNVTVLILHFFSFLATIEICGSVDGLVELKHR